MPARKLYKLVLATLEDSKGIEITDLDVHELTQIADHMIICTGTSRRHVQSLADNVAHHAKQAGYQVFGIEGQQEGEWVLVDLGEVIVHVMLAPLREFYSLEKLWASAKQIRKKSNEN